MPLLASDALAPRSHGRRARAQFDADTSTILNDPLARSVAQFLQQREPHRSADGGGARTAASDSRTPRRSREDASGRGALERPSRGRPLWLPRLGRDGIERVVISLSGGVDSMVLAMILVALRDAAAEHDGDAAHDRACEIVAIHIDYANRPESELEARFVARWCAARRVRLTVRVISEVTRGVTARDEYEKLSRAARYTAYAKVLAEKPNEPTGVMLAHHAGDVVENVLSNSMRGSSVLALAGMAPEGVVEGVRVWRPWLAHDKSEIFAFARRCAAALAAARVGTIL